MNAGWKKITLHFLAYNCHKWNACACGELPKSALVAGVRDDVKKHVVYIGEKSQFPDPDGTFVILRVFFSLKPMNCQDQVLD